MSLDTMFSSYFFVPANKIHFVKKAIRINAEFIVFDLEESVSINEIKISISNLSEVVVKNNYYIRYPFNYSNLDNNINFLKELVDFGFSKYILPKLNTVEDYSNVTNVFKSLGLNNVEFILLIENPLALLNLPSILKSAIKRTKAIMIGSHDYCNAIGAKHNDYNLYYLRQAVLTYAKAFGFKVIDNAFVDLTDKDNYQKECVNAFQMGFDGKIVLHPNQLDYLKTANYYSESEITEAFKVYKFLNGTFPSENIIIKVDNRIYEMPHMRRLFNIISWSKSLKEA